ncbi:MAG: hypothetical protein H0X36_00770 [Sphingomonadaceae bacterium]|nr:hypothetical protein [Sphingomonadaceae bacterium]
MASAASAASITTAGCAARAACGGFEQRRLHLGVHVLRFGFASQSGGICHTQGSVLADFTLLLTRRGGLTGLVTA